MDSRRHNTLCLKHLFTYSQLFCSAPLYDFDQNTPINSNFYKSYNFIILLIFLTTNLLFLNIPNMKQGGIASTHLKLPQRISSDLYTIPLNIHPFLSIYITWKKRKEWNYILRVFVFVDRYFKGGSGTNLYFYSELLLGNLIIIYVFFAGIYFSRFGIPLHEVYLGGVRYIIFLRSFLVYNVAIALGYRFGELNSKLECCGSEQDGRDLTKIYCRLSECVKRFNGIFAFDLFLLFMEMFVTLVVFLNFFINPYRKLGYWDVWLYTSRLLQGIFQVICVTAIVRSCEMSEGNARRTGRLALEIIRGQGRAFAGDEMNWLRDLARIRPRFSAGGLFDINSKNLIISWGLVFSYLIIALTMNKK